MAEPNFNSSALTNPAFIPVGERAQQLDLLLHLQEFSSMAILITGPAGVGKSALLLAVDQQLSISHTTSILQAHKLMGEGDVIRQLAQHLQCEESSDQISEAVDDLSNDQESLHILVDDAHLLEVEALQYLIDLSVNNESVHLVLAGDAGIETQLKLLQARLKLESLYHKIDLLPFDESELIEFLTDLYLQVGQETLPLSQQKIHQLWNLTGGLPLKVLELLEVEEEQQEKKARRFPVGHVGAIALIAIALLVSFAYQGDNSTSTDAEGDPIAEILAMTPEEAFPSDELQNGITEEEMTSSPEASGVEQPESSSSQVLDDVQEPLISEDASLKITAEAQHPKTNEPEEIDSKLDQRADGTTTVASDITLQKSKHEPKQLSSAKSNARPVKPLPEPQLPEHPLLAEPPQTFAMQLLGVHNQKSADEFINKLTSQVGSDLLSVYQTKYKNQPWFVVVYGPFEDRTDAENAVKTLPAALQRQRPWIRQLSKIQEDIRKAKL